MNTPHYPSPLRRSVSATDLEPPLQEEPHREAKQPPLDLNVFNSLLPPPQEEPHREAKRTHTSLIEDMINNNERPSARVKLVFNQ
jgi:hypothetical protein